MAHTNPDSFTHGLRTALTYRYVEAASHSRARFLLLIERFSLLLQQQWFERASEVIELRRELDAPANPCMCVCVCVCLQVFCSGHSFNLCAHTHMYMRARVRWPDKLCMASAFRLAEEEEETVMLPWQHEPPHVLTRGGVSVR